VKRLVLLAVLAVGFTLTAAPAATPAGGGDSKGPGCGDITGAEIGYNGTEGGSATFDFIGFLAKPNCSSLTYSLFVTDTNGDPVTATPVQDTNCTPPPESGGGCFHVQYVFTSAAKTLCVYATTSRVNHLIDYAPDVADATCTGPSPSSSVGLNGFGASGNFG
jgi:hypothetical protein